MADSRFDVLRRDTQTGPVVPLPGLDSPTPTIRPGYGFTQNPSGTFTPNLPPGGAAYTNAGGIVGENYAQNFPWYNPSGGDTFQQMPGTSIPAPSLDSPLADPSGLTAFRQAADAARYYEDQTDTNLQRDPRYADFLRTGQYAPSLQPFPEAETSGANFGHTGSYGTTVGAPGGAPPRIGPQFDDPYTKQLEDITSAQMGQVRSNPGLNQLTQFLQQLLGEYSQQPGYSDQERALLNTQAFEPIEDLRKSAHERSLQRTASRGLLPSSGVAELDSRNVDQYYDRLRTQANRDLAVNAIDRRDDDLQRAQGLAQILGLDLPRGQRQEELSLASLLYDLPRNALTDALAVLNGSPTSQSLYSQTLQSQQNQQYNQALNAQRWTEIGRMLGELLA